MNLAKAKRSIRNKLRTLRDEQFTTEHAVRKSLTPVIAPLEKANVLQSKISASTTDTAEDLKYLREKLDELEQRQLEQEMEDPSPEEDWDKQLAEDEGAAAAPNTSHVFKFPDNPQDVQPNTSPQKSPDNEYGPRVDANGLESLLGSKTYQKTLNTILVGSHKFPRTDGLVDMIENEKPLWKDSTDQDKINYQTILAYANPHKHFNSPTAKMKHSTRNSYKYHFIQKIIAFDPTNPPPGPPKTRSATAAEAAAAAKDASGKGLIFCGGGRRRQRTRLPRNPNDLVDRLRLLSASKEAGHTGHNSEIQTIIKTLRRRGYIE